MIDLLRTAAVAPSSSLTPLAFAAFGNQRGNDGSSRRDDRRQQFFYQFGAHAEPRRVKSHAAVEHKIRGDRYRRLPFHLLYWLYNGFFCRIQR